jgi:ABC-type bacteriocin/lantibiotic exporter with double-glycine peptidase domain
MEVWKVGLLVSALNVPFVPQARDTCGAASLTMVLRYWGGEVTHDEVARELLEPELHGIPGSRLAEFARARGFEALAYKGDLFQLQDFVGKGRPLIVAWGLGRDRFHNVVVVGVEAEGGAVIVNDPARGPGRRIPRGTFDKRWAKADYWTLLVMRGKP